MIKDKINNIINRIVNTLNKMFSFCIYVFAFSIITFSIFIYGFIEYKKYNFNESFKNLKISNIYNKNFDIEKKEEFLTEKFKDNNISIINFKNFLDKSEYNILLKNSSNDNGIETNINIKNKNLLNEKKLFLNILEKELVKDHLLNEVKIYNENEIDKQEFYVSLHIYNGNIKKIENKTYIDKKGNLLNGIVKTKILPLNEDNKFVDKKKISDNDYYENSMPLVYITLVDGKINGKIILCDFDKNNVDKNNIKIYTITNSDINKQNISFINNKFEYKIEFIEKVSKESFNKFSVEKDLYKFEQVQKDFIYNVEKNNMIRKELGITKKEIITKNENTYIKIYLSNGNILNVFNKELIYIDNLNYYKNKNYYNLDTLFHYILKIFYRQDGLNNVYEHFYKYTKNNEEITLKNNEEWKNIIEIYNNKYNDINKTKDLDLNDNLSEEDKLKIKTFIDKFKN